MPGLSRNFRRPTINSSQQNDSVWHSTPIDTTDTSSVDGSRSGTTGIGTEGSATEGDNDNDLDFLISPVKRPALGNGDRPLPIGVRDARKETPTMAAGPSRPAGLADRLKTPAPAAALTPRTAIEDVVMDSDDDEPDLFANMVSSSQSSVSVAQAETATGSSVVPETNATATNNNLHISQRYGTINISPPCGHAYLSRILHENGFILTTPKNYLVEDVMHFREKLSKWLDDHSNEMSRIEDETTRFMKGARKYFSSKENVIYACTPTLNDRECVQPSLTACLLGVKHLQMTLLEVMMPILCEAAAANTQKEIDFVGTLANQMKWLPILADGPTFASKLLDVLETANIYSQKHIVRLLPEIFLPDYHPLLVPRLMEIFDMGTQLNVSMLDCFASLVTPESECLKIRRSAVDQMANAPLEDVPAYLSFLFRVGSSLTQLEDGIKEMREKIVIKPKVGIPKKEDPQQIEILERIRWFASVNAPIIKIWLAQIKEDLNCDADLPTLDLLMLLVFVECGDRSSQLALSCLFTKPKIIIGMFDKMMDNNNQMLHALFQTIARFLDEILRGKNPKLHEATIDIVKKLFVGLGPHLAQDLTANLIGVLINGHPNCRDVVLKIFESIAKTDAKKLLYFHSYLMGTLVYVMNYPPKQMQALMNILAILAYIPENQDEENAFTQEFMILLRKQITHTSLRTRCFGVLGTVSAVSQLARYNPELNEGKIDSLLALAWVSIENDEEACNIFFDKLITIIHLLPKVICSRFRDILKGQFEKLWIFDQASDSQLLRSQVGQAGLKLEATYDANKEMNNERLVIVFEPQALQISPLVIPAHFRAMAELEKVAENGLDGIDAVLGCPIFFPKLSYFERDTLEDLNHNERLHLGQYLILAINYFRECTSAFVESENRELRVKIWFRLQNIVALQKILVKHHTSFLNLPMGYGGENALKDAFANPGFGGGGPRPGTSTSAAAAAQAKKVANASKKKKPKAVKKKAKRGKKKKKQNEEEDEEHDILADEDETMAASAPAPVGNSESHCLNLEETIQPKFIRDHIRHFDIHVFDMIKFPFQLQNDAVDYSGILHNLSAATQSSETMNSVEQFNVEGLALLLIELKTQTIDKTWNFDILSVKSLLENLCSHLESVSEILCKMDTPDHPKKSELLSILQLLINVMDLYFNAVSNSKKELRIKLTETAISIVSARYKSDNQDEDDVEQLTSLSQEELLENVAKYLGNIANVIDEDPLLAQDHIKLLKTVHDLLPRPDQIKKAIDVTVKEYLKNNWRLPSQVISFFLKTWLTTNPKPLKVIGHLVKNLILDAGDEGNQCVPNSSLYQTCTKINFHTWYSAIFSGLAQHVMKMGRRRGDFEDSIDLWMQGNDILLPLILVSQSNKMRKSAILIPLLKNSRVYVEAFVSGGACLLPELWKRDMPKGQSFTKTLQTSTRKLQYICEHAKVVKDSTLLRYVPAAKKALEMLLFRVREGLANVAPGAFWVGALKHRNLDGDVINSQPFKKDSDDESDYSEETEPVAPVPADIQLSSDSEPDEGNASEAEVMNWNSDEDEEDDELNWDDE